MVGVYSDPCHVVAYTDGEVRQQFSLCFHANPIKGVLTRSDESTDVRWVQRNDLDSYDIHTSTLLRITHGYEKRSKPYLG